jgi:hypothetical protein
VAIFWLGVCGFPDGATVADASPGGVAEGVGDCPSAAIAMQTVRKQTTMRALICFMQ